MRKLKISTPSLSRNAMVHSFGRGNILRVILFKKTFRLRLMAVLQVKRPWNRRK